MKTAYTYTILRYMHDTLTGEFINVGVALLAPRVRYAGAICRPTYSRLSKTFPGLDGEAFKGLMRFIQSRFEELGERLSGEFPFEKEPENILELAHSILPPDDSSLQWSPMGSGLTDNPSQTLDGLYRRLVAKYDDPAPKERRPDHEVWRSFRRALEPFHVLKHLQPKSIVLQDDEAVFPYAWKNQIWHCLQPLSFDLSAEGIKDKSHGWFGQIMSLQGSTDKFKVYLLVGRPQQASVQKDFQRALSMLHRLPADKEIVQEEEAESFSERFAKEIEEHEPGG